MRSFCIEGRSRRRVLLGRLLASVGKVGAHGGGYLFLAPFTYLMNAIDTRARSTIYQCLVGLGVPNGELADGRVREACDYMAAIN